jgi:hypothetical protein
MAAKRGVWGDEIKKRFLALVRETGNVRATLRVVGHPNMFYKRRRRDPDFAREWAEAVAGADVELSRAERAFPDTTGEGMGINGSVVPPARPEHRGAMFTRGFTSNCPLPTSAEELGGYLRPGRKRAQARPQPVIRRTSSGRAQIALAREGHMTAESEAAFLALLRATGNFAASARAIGFQPASLHQRAEKWPAFGRDCRAAQDAADVQLDYALVAHAHMLLGMGRVESPSTTLGTNGEEVQVPFDPEAAMRIIAFLDRRKAGLTGGRHKGAPERSFDEVVESIMSKIEAIERHEAMFGKDEGDGEDG